MNIGFWRHYLRARFFQIAKRPEKAIEEYRLALGFDHRFTRAWHNIAYLLARQARYAEAEAHLREAQRAEPNDADIRFNLGFVCDKRGLSAEAIEAFREAVRLDPKHDRAWYGLGYAYAALGRHEEAAQALQQAAMLRPMNPHAWYALGMARHRLHQPDQVKEVVQHLFRFDPHMTRRLIRDAERGDLAHMVKDLEELPHGR